MHLDRKARWPYCQGCWRACTRAGLPAFAGTQVLSSNRGMENPYHWLLAKGIRAENTAVTGQSIGGNLAVSLAIELCNQGVASPADILSVSGSYDLKNYTIKSNL